MAPWAPRSLPPLSTCWRPSIRLLQPFFPATISREILMGRRLICPLPVLFLALSLRTTPEAVTKKLTAAGHVSPADSYEYGKWPPTLSACRLIKGQSTLGICITATVWSLEAGHGAPSPLLFPNNYHRAKDNVHKHKKCARIIKISRQCGRGLDWPSITLALSRRAGHINILQEAVRSLGGYSDPPSWYRAEGRGHGCIVISSFPIANLRAKIRHQDSPPYQPRISSHACCPKDTLARRCRAELPMTMSGV